MLNKDSFLTIPGLDLQFNLEIIFLKFVRNFHNTIVNEIQRGINAEV